MDRHSWKAELDDDNKEDEYEDRVLWTFSYFMFHQRQDLPVLFL